MAQQGAQSMRSLRFLAVAIACMVAGHSASAADAPKVASKPAAPAPSKFAAPPQASDTSARKTVRLATRTPRLIVVIHGVQY